MQWCRTSTNVEYLESCSGWEGLVECVQLFHCKKMNWTQIINTAVHLQVVLGVEFVMVVLSKQKFLVHLQVVLGVEFVMP